jgi:uncharacterized protein (DUF58 family)
MAFGTTDRRKADVAEGAAIAVAHVSTRRGNRLGVVVLGEGDQRFYRPQQGRSGLMAALHVVRDRPAGSVNLRKGLNLLDALATQPSVVVIVSDFRDPVDWHRELLRLAAHHQVLAVEVRDEREQTLVDVGELRLFDPETGDQLTVDTGDQALRELFAAAAADDRRALATGFAFSGVPHVALSTEGDWLRPLTSFLKRPHGRS